MPASYYRKPVQFETPWNLGSVTLLPDGGLFNFGAWEADGGYFFYPISHAEAPTSVDVSFTLDDIRHIGIYAVGYGSPFDGDQNADGEILGVYDDTLSAGNHTVNVTLSYSGTETFGGLTFFDANGQANPVGSEYDPGGSGGWTVIGDGPTFHDPTGITITDISFPIGAFWEDFTDTEWDSDNQQLKKSSKIFLVNPGSPGFPADPGEPETPARVWYTFEERTVYDEIPVNPADRILVFIPSDASLPDGPGHWTYVSPEGYSQSTTTIARKIVVRVKHETPYKPGRKPSPPIPEHKAQYRIDNNINWNASAISIDSGNGDFDFKFKIPRSALGVIIGMSNLGESHSRANTTVDYAFYASTGRYTIVENGVVKTTSAIYSNGQEFRIVRASGTVYYHVNGALVYSSLTKSDGDYRAFAFLYGANDTVSNASLSFSAIGSQIGSPVTNNFDLNFEVPITSKSVLVAVYPSGGNASDSYFGFHFELGTYAVIENGEIVFDYTAYTTGDVFRILREGRTVKYLVNGIVVYTSEKEANAVTYLAKKILFNAGDSIASDVFTNNTDGFQYGKSPGNYLAPLMVLGFTDLNANEQAGVLYLLPLVADDGNLNERDTTTQRGTLILKPLGMFASTSEGYTEGRLLLSPIQCFGENNAIVDPDFQAGTLYLQPLFQEYSENITGGVQEGTLYLEPLAAFGSQEDDIQQGALQLLPLGFLAYNNPTETIVVQGDLILQSLSIFASQEDDIQQGALRFLPLTFNRYISQIEPYPYHAGAGNYLVSSGISEATYFVKPDEITKYFAYLNGVNLGIKSLKIAENLVSFTRKNTVKVSWSVSGLIASASVSGGTGSQNPGTAASSQIEVTFITLITYKRQIVEIVSPDSDTILSALSNSSTLEIVQSSASGDKTLFSGIIDPIYTSHSLSASVDEIGLKAKANLPLAKVGSNFILSDVKEYHSDSSGQSIVMPWNPGITIFDTVNFNGASFKVLATEFSLTSDTQTFSVKSRV